MLRDWKVFEEAYLSAGPVAKKLLEVAVHIMGSKLLKVGISIVLILVAAVMLYAAVKVGGPALFALGVAVGLMFAFVVWGFFKR